MSDPSAVKTFRRHGCERRHRSYRALAMCMWPRAEWVAGDSMPPLRLAVLADVGEHAGSRTSDVRARLQRPRSTVDRELQALHVLGLLVQYGGDGSAWQYDLSASVDRDVLKQLVTRKVSTGNTGIQKEEPSSFLPTDNSGDAWPYGGAA